MSKKFGGQIRNIQSIVDALRISRRTFYRHNCTELSELVDCVKDLGRALRPSEVAMMLGVTRTSVYQWVSIGQLKGIKVGSKTIRVMEKHLIEFLEQAEENHVVLNQ